MSLSSFHSFVHRARFASFTSLASSTLLALGAATAAFAPACGGGDDDTTPTGSKDGGGGDATTAVAVAPTGPYARFTLPGAALPNFLDVPFPSDVYLGTNHFVTENIPAVGSVITNGASFLTHELAKANGFSRISLALFWIDDAANGNAAATVDRTTLPTNETDCAKATSSVFLVDLAPASGGATLLPCRARYHDDGATAVRPGLGIGPARGYLLAEGHSYAAVLTSRVKDLSGKALGASLDFQNAVNGARTDANAALYAAAVAKVKTALGSALASDGASIVAVAPYTTQSQSSQLFTLRDTLESQPAPTLHWDAATMAPMGAVTFAGGATAPAGYTATLDALLGPAPVKNTDGSDSSDAKLPQVAHDKIAALGTAVFTAPNYLQAKTGGNDTLDNATFSFDASGNIIPDPTTPTAKIWATITIPVGTMPASGWPVVIAQHGLGQSRSFVMTLANTYAARGWATVAIDSVTFGARAPEAMYQVDQTNTWVADPGATYTGPDGFADLVGATIVSAGSTNGATDFFGGLKNLGAIRDQLRQAMMDAVELVKVVRGNPDLTPLTLAGVKPKLDPAKVVYIGNSLGAMEAVGAAALEPSVKAWTLNVGGGGVFTELASHGPTVANYFLEAGGEYFGLKNDTLDEAHPLVIMAQNLLEPGDPIEFAPFLVKTPHTLAGAATTARNILQVEVVYDELVSNESDEALARAAGYGMATPNVGSNSGVTDLADLTKSVDPVPLAQVSPAGDGTIHDTPNPGYTAVLVQQSPGEHGSNLVESVSQRTWKIPYLGANGMNSFNELPTANDPVAANSAIPCSYLEIQTAIDGFFSSALAGGVPTVAGFKTPVRDADGDGVLDATDANPLDPTVH
jgi:dienelactone hydrolase